MIEATTIAIPRLPPWLRDVLGNNSYEAIRRVSLPNQDATDANLAHVGRLAAIQELEIVGAR